MQTKDFKALSYHGFGGGKMDTRSKLEFGRMNDEDFMRLALNLAELGRGFTRPNPMVGAVIVKDGRIVGIGYHKKAGLPHAERIALADAGEHARNATMFVTLEPCVHYGRTPPCADAIIEAGLARVVVAALDPNPVVHGKGVQKLREAGISVTVGILEKEAKRLNEAFFKYMETGKPFVALKLAVTLDGKLADATGNSKWISSAESRRFVHKLRGEYDGIAVGINTVLADDPMLTARTVYPPAQPTRFVIDPHLRIPLNSKVLNGDARTVIVASEDADESKLRAVHSKGAEVWQLPSKDGRIDLSRFIEVAGQHGIQSLLFEGGGAIAASLLRNGLVDKLYMFFAPKMFGGGHGIAHFDGFSAVRPLEFDIDRTLDFDGDVLIVAYPKAK